MSIARKPVIRYVSVYGGHCTLTTATRAQIMKRHGTANVDAIRNATSEDIANVEAMGGYVPDGRIARTRAKPTA